MRKPVYNVPILLVILSSVMTASQPALLTKITKMHGEYIKPTIRLYSIYYANVLLTHIFKVISIDVGINKFERIAGKRN